MRKTSIVLLIALLCTIAFSSLCFATSTRPAVSAGTRPARTITISDIKVSITAPTYGKAFDWKPVFETAGLTFDHMYWEGKDLTDAGGWVGINESTTAVATKYKATIYFTVNTGYVLSSSLKTGSVNGVDGCELVSLTFSPHGIKTQEFEVALPTRPAVSTGTRPTRPAVSTGTRPTRPTTETGTVTRPSTSNEVEAISLSINEVKVGEKLPSEGKMKVASNEATFAIPMSNLLMTTSWTPNDEVAKADTEYVLNVKMHVADPAQYANCRVLLNNVEIPSKLNGNDIIATYKVKTPKAETAETVTTPPAEPNWINKFEVKVTEPKAGAKPATTAKEISDGFDVEKVVWTPADSKFVEGKDYTVRIYITIDKDRTLRSDYFGIINGKDATMPVNYDKDNFYIEYNFGKISWAKASEWAEVELGKANDLLLIPSIFNQQDLTTDITRREFAHVAVKLYEKVSGQKAIAVANNPFTDTDDGEVLKALNVGITNGTSETTFEPDTLITREQMATMMTRALAKAGINTAIDLNKVEKFKDDAKMNDWGRPSIYFMSSIGIIKGVGDNTFDVTGKATREQSVIISERSAEKYSK